MSFQLIRKIRQKKRQNRSIFGFQQVQTPQSPSKPEKMDFQFLLNQAQGLITSKHFYRKIQKEESTRRQTRKSSHGRSLSIDKTRLTPLNKKFQHVNLEQPHKTRKRRLSDTARTPKGLSGQKKDCDKVLSPEKKISLSDYNLDFVVGKGGFGKVWKGRQKKTNKIYAIKQMQKVKIIEKKSVESIMNEKNLLSKLKNPFLVNMHCAFQNKQNLFLVMDYCNRGDLRYHIGMRQKFKQNQSKFFIACIVICLQYLHKKNIIHRDLKPQNLVLDNNGYVRVTDLGVSREVKQDNAPDTSGTPGYMAPQVICRMDHSFPVDYFALGVMGYQFMMGKRPYLGQNRKQIRQKILAKQVQLGQIPPFGWSKDSIDFVNKLIQRNPENRLGFRGIQQIKNHPWLKDFQWQKLKKKKIFSPYIPPTIQDDYVNFKQCISEDTQMLYCEQYQLILRHPQTQRVFYGYETSQKRNKKMEQKNLNRKNQKKQIQQFLHIHTVRDKNKIYRL